MSDDLIIIMVLQILSILSGLLTPLIMAFSTFIGRIEHSECCKSRIDLSDVKVDKKKEKKEKKNDGFEDITEYSTLKRSPNINIP